MQITIDAGDWPAWIQAVGSIAAIGVAILVARHESKSQRNLRQEELARARNEAESRSRVLRQLIRVQLITPLIVLDIALKNAEVTITSLRQLGNRFDAARHLGFAEIDFFETLIDRIEQLPEADAVALIDLLSTLRGYRNAIEAGAKTPGGLAGVSAETIATLQGLAVTVRPMVREAAKRFDIPLPE